jgi:hypothetical protein
MFHRGFKESERDATMRKASSKTDEGEGLLRCYQHAVERENEGARQAREKGESLASLTVSRGKHLREKAKLRRG